MKTGAFTLGTILLCTLCACVPRPVAPVINATQTDEPYRPQIHFSPPSKWMNDPNGLVYFKGEYHLFYQYFPGDIVWGPMHWGHAVSLDLVHWQHLPIALYPDSLGYIFSGSVVVDWQNSSGLGQNGEPPLAALFTYHDMAAEKAGKHDFQNQGLAYSNDRGRTWVKYEGNPVLPNPGTDKDFRDPKVMWDEARQQWVMTLAVKDHVEFWGSKNLKKWTLLSQFGQKHGAHGGVWECPDLFPIRVKDASETKWVLLVSINPGGPNGGSATQYFTGEFDGKNFVPDPGFDAGNSLWVDYGRDNYAGVTWSDIPQQDGRRLFIGWMSNWDYAQVVPTASWRSAMTLPRSLELKKTAKGYRLYSQPVREIQALYDKTAAIGPAELRKDLNITQTTGLGKGPVLLDLEFAWPRGAAPDFGVRLKNPGGETYRIGFDALRNQFYSDRTLAGANAFSSVFGPNVHYAPRIETGKTMRLKIVLDVASCELFADEGATTMTEIFFPSGHFTEIELYSGKETVQLVRGSIYRLKSIWP